VVVGIETDRGPWVQALLAAGYQVYAINPLSASRYRERHVTSGAKSDPGDAKVLADLVRTDRQHHRPIAGDSELAETLAVTLTLAVSAGSACLGEARRRVVGVVGLVGDFRWVRWRCRVAGRALR